MYVYLVYHFGQRKIFLECYGCPCFVGSMSSLESGRSTESLFDTVYDISVKEEALRKEITEVDQFIQYFRNVIDEATIQLNRYNERKLRVC